MDYKEKYKMTLEKIRAIYDKIIFSARIEDAKFAEKLEEIFSELKESGDEKFRKYILRCCEETISADDGGLVLSMDTTIKLKNWLEKQGESIDTEKVLIGAREDVALSIMHYLDNNTQGMCLSNMECEDLENAVVNSDWGKVYRYMKKKLEGQSELKTPNIDGIEFKIGDAISVNGTPFDYEHASITQKDYAPKVKPKFHEGDWVVSPNGVYWHIDRIENNRYKVTSDAGACADWPLSTNLYHLWTIEDAKAGDVLVHDDCVFIFMGIEDDIVKAFSFEDNLLDLLDSECPVSFGEPNEGDVYYPATKEQRDLLFKKIKEAGYTFDFEKKELKKIEQKPTYMVKPKFKVGDWITDGYVGGQITSIENNYPCYKIADFMGGINTSIPFRLQDKYHLWTIQDAKDGDVLVASDDSIFLFKSTIDCACKYYVALTTDSSVKFNEGLEHYWETSRTVHPATKEQRDILFRKMHEAGYEWLEETKELKRIEQKTSDSYCREHCKGYQETAKCFADGDCKAKVEVEHKSWSEEDNVMLNGAECWLYTLCDYLRDGSSNCVGKVRHTIAWLESLRPQNRWKPTELQMEILHDAIGRYEGLGSLYDDLKRL